MAARGGRGGNPEAFGTGSGEGAAKASKYAGYDYAGEWEGKRISLSNQPLVPSSIDADGTVKDNAEEVAHHTKRQAAWNAAYEAQKQAAKTDTAPKAPVSPLLRSPKPSKNPTNRTPGVHVDQQMGIKEFGQKVAGLHSILKAHAGTVGSVALRPEAEAQVNVANGHLDDAKFHIGEAEKARRGVVIGNKRYSGDAEAGKHYIAAVKSLRSAHDALGSEHVQHATYVHNLTAELPTEHLAGIEAASKTIPILKDGKSFKEIPFGGAKIDPNTVDVREAKKLVGKQTTAVAKIEAGQKGSKRQDKFKVVSGQEEKSLGGLPGKEVRTPGRKGAVGTPINPMRPASKERAVSDRVPNADMSRFKTPTFEGDPRSKPNAAEMAKFTAAYKARQAAKKKGK